MFPQNTLISLLGRVVAINLEGGKLPPYKHIFRLEDDMAIPKDELPVREILDTIHPQGRDASQMILGLDDLLVLFCECEDESDLEKPYYIYATPAPDVLYPETHGSPCCPNCKNKKKKNGEQPVQGPQQYKCREIDDCPIRGHRTIIRIL